METNNKENVQETVKQEEVNNVANDPKTEEQPKAEERTDNKEEKTKIGEFADNLMEKGKEIGKKHKKEFIATGIGAAIGAMIMYFLKKKD